MPLSSSQEIPSTIGNMASVRLEPESSTSAANPQVARAEDGLTRPFLRVPRGTGSSRRLSTGNVSWTRPLFDDASARSNHDINGSPQLRRAGLLQPMSYNPSNIFGSYNDPRAFLQNALRNPPHPHSQDTIRSNTMQLSSMTFSSTPSSSLSNPLVQASAQNDEAATSGFIFPEAGASPDGESSPSPPSSLNEDLMQSQVTVMTTSSDLPSANSSTSRLTSSIPSLVTHKLDEPESSSSPASPLSEQTTPRMPFRPSGLSLLRQEYESHSRPGSDGSRTPVQTFQPKDLPSDTDLPPPKVHWSDKPALTRVRQSSNATISQATTTAATAHPRLLSPDVNLAQDQLQEETEDAPQMAPPSVMETTEVTPLLQDRPWRFSPTRSGAGLPHYSGSPHNSPQRSPSRTSALTAWKDRIAKRWETRDPDLVKNSLRIAAKSIPAVLLGCLLNILDGVSYGMIIFPGNGVFSDLGPMGVSMFFASTIISQLTYTLGGSGFAGANGSMMIEVVPFFHILANSIADQIGESNPNAIIATTLVAFAFNSLLTGLTFFILGYLKLGNLIGFFPRHILVGCIGGVGVFLVLTGFTVSMRIGDDDLGLDWETVETMFLNTHNLILWVVPLLLAILLRLITAKYHHQLIFPIYFLIIPIIFYIIVAAARLDLETLKADGWLFDLGVGDATWYRFYQYYNIHDVHFGPLWATMSTQFALLFFNILHPPLNVPALGKPRSGVVRFDVLTNRIAVSLDEDVDTNKELVGHGYSNFLSGLFGTVPTYLVYVNTLLLYRVGGVTRIAGFMLGIANIFLLIWGTSFIGYIPVTLVGALIFVLGIDLIKEAVWDPRHRASRTEYITIISIMVCMTAWDFVTGVLFGIVVSCFFFVVQNSQRRSIRALQSGETAMSTVRRPSLQREYLREVSKQTTILRLQGFLFFGTISHVEETIREIIEGPSWQSNPVRFLVLDLSLVAGVDMSSAEAFVRIHRFLAAKEVTLVFCGISSTSPIADALNSVHVLNAPNVEVFLTFNDAMEWTENAYLRAWLLVQKHEIPTTALALPGRREFEVPPGSPTSFASSPRQVYMRDVGARTIANELHHRTDGAFSTEPMHTIMKAFSSYGEIDPIVFQPIAQYLERIAIPEGTIMWHQGDRSDGLYIVEAGILRASYHFSDHTQVIEESMVPGTVAGELSALSSLPRNATMLVERDAVLWKLSSENLAKLELERPQLSRAFVGLILKAAKIDHDILLSALASRP